MCFPYGCRTRKATHVSVDNLNPNIKIALSELRSDEAGRKKIVGVGRRNLGHRMEKCITSKQIYVHIKFSNNKKEKKKYFNL